MQTLPTNDNQTRFASFSSGSGCEEVFISMESSQGAGFSNALSELAERYEAALRSKNLSDTTAVFARLFISDVINQQQALVRSPLYHQLRSSGALSIIEQKPVTGGPVALLSYHIRNPQGTFEKQLVGTPADGMRNELLVRGDRYSLLWTANYTNSDTFDGYAQTKTIFNELTSTIRGQGMNLLDNALRTWIYVRDVDNHYKDMVRARREFFAVNDLTEKTRYLASTGILGLADAPEKIVSVDSLSIGGLAQGQIVRMEAPSHMSPTISYGVTFERGLRVRFGDRSHLHISGTASINNKGEVLHLGDAEAQTRRMLENVRVLLDAQGATFDHLMYIIVYVRNIHDRYSVERVLKEQIDDRIPFVLVDAPVCRPTWLVELEGIAVVPDETAFPSFF